MKIPWWIKIILKIVLSRLGIPYSFWQSIGLFRHGEMNDYLYAFRVFKTHLERLGLPDINGFTILELGPGDSVASAMIAYSLGARAILVDAGKYASRDVTVYKNLEVFLKVQGFTPPCLSACETLEQVLDASGARYLVNGKAGLDQIPSETVDIVFSQAVLEHIPIESFDQTVVSLYRILKKGGRCSHEIDLRDHLEAGLNNLRFSHSIWESKLFANSGFYTNRLRYPDIIRSFDIAGFKTEVVLIEKWSSLPTKRSRLATQFRKINEKDLLVSVFAVTQSKPH